MPLIYLDNNATTQVAPEVIDAMRPFLEERWGNPSSLYTFGSDLQRNIEKAREQVARLIGAKRPSEIIFTSSGTESDVTAITSALAQNPDKKHIVTTTVEHSAVLLTLRDLATKGYQVTFLPVHRDGLLDLDTFMSSLRDDTALVSIMWANNETGVIFPIEPLADACAARNIPLHVDAVQAAGKIPIDVSRVPVTYLSLSGHKLHAPKGIGALFVRRGTKFTPLFLGNQEMNRRGGTENVAAIVGLGKSCELAAQYLTEGIGRVTHLRDRLECEILSKIARSSRNGATGPRVPNTFNVSFEGVESEALLLLLNEVGICASSGSACSSGSLEPSHVLAAMGVPKNLAHGALRLSFSRFTTEAEIDHVVATLPAIIARLRGQNS